MAEPFKTVIYFVTYSTQIIWVHQTVCSGFSIKWLCIHVFVRCYVIHVSCWPCAFRNRPFFLFPFFFVLQFYFIFKLYIIVLVLPNIKTNLPQVYTCSPSWTLLPPSLSFLKLDLNGVWIHRAGKGIKDLLNIWKAPRTKCFLILPLFFPPSCW